MVVLLLTWPTWLTSRIFEILGRSHYFSKDQLRTDFQFLMRLAVVLSLLVLALLLMESISPEKSLGVLFILSLSFSGVLKTLKLRQKKVLRREFTVSLSSLQGLLELGVPFPQAIHTISEFHSVQLSQVLKKVIERFKKGYSIETTCNSLEKKVLSSEIAHSLKILEVAYHRGASLTPVIQVLQPILEQEIGAQEKNDSIQRHLWAQAIFAAIAPWGIILVSGFFQPELVESFFSHPSTSLWVIVALAWEAIGLWFIQRRLSF